MQQLHAAGMQSGPIAAALGCSQRRVQQLLREEAGAAAEKLPVHPELEHFAHIVPCGISDRPVGSVAQLLREQGQGDASLRALTDAELLARAHAALLRKYPPKNIGL